MLKVTKRPATLSNEPKGYTTKYHPLEKNPLVIMLPDLIYTRTHQ